MTEWDWVESEERINSNNLFLFFHTTRAYTSTFKFWMNLFLNVLQLSLAADLRWLGAPSHKEAGYNPMMRMIPVLHGRGFFALCWAVYQGERVNAFNREIKIHVYAKRQTWICTTWPSFPLIFHLLVTASTQK